MSKPHLHKVIGIDLGTTYSAVAAFNTDPASQGPEMLMNSAEDQKDTTASVISLDPLTRKAVVGGWAKRNRPADPENTIIEIKREMGETFNPETLAKFHGERGQYQVGDAVRVFFNGRWMLPQEMSAFTLMRMKQVAEEEIGEEIRDAVITVPAYFKEQQRAATRQAALLAGLHPRQILPEPTAAAIAYGLEKYETEKKVYLVYDLGGGTFDVSIIEVEGDNIGVISTSGDSRLGGGDFDDAIAAWAEDQLARQFRFNPGALLNERALRFRAELKLKAERAKVVLSDAAETVLIFPELMQDLHVNVPPQLVLRREKFEELIGVHLRRSLSYADDAITRAEGRVQREQIDAVILVGGSSKIPRVRSLLQEHFQKGEDFVRADANPDQVVAKGAAIMARRYLPSPPPFDIRRPVDESLVDREAMAANMVQAITEHSLGVGVQDGLVVRIISQGTNIPVDKTKDDFTNGGPVDMIPVPVFQGESQYQAECTEIGIVRIENIEPLPPQQHRFAVKFALDMNGLLTATINQVKTGKSWTAAFQQKGVVGVDALVIMREQLVGMFAGIVSGPPMVPMVAPGTSQLPGLPPPPAAGAMPPGMPLPPGSVQPWGQPGAVPAATPPPPGTMPWGYPPTTMPPGQVVPTVNPAAPSPPQPVPMAASAGTGGAPLVMPSVAIGGDDAQLVRRSHKLLLTYPDAKLMRSCNAYVTALNNGVGGDDLSDLLADLKDAFEDARRQAP